MTLESPQPQNSIDKQVENGLDFILSHFLDYMIFPRNVTATELIDQKKNFRFKTVLLKKDALAHFKKYNYVDCRINAFAYLKDGILLKPELLFIDLDLADLKSRKSLDLVLSKTLKTIREKLGDKGYPTVLWSGNGYHIIQPVECPIELERIQQFSKYDKPSEQFLRFAKDYLSNGKADKNNYPSFNSCLLRIPGSINSKCLDNKEKRLSGNIRVKVLQKWNGYRPLITRELLYNFHTYLNQKKSIERKNSQEKQSRSFTFLNNSNNNNEIEWVEKLILIPVTEYRKRAIDLIFVPYFILVKKLSNEETTQIITKWLEKCNSIRNIDFDIKYKINAAIKTTNKKQIYPMKKDTLKNNYEYLYSILQNKKGDLI